MKGKPTAVHQPPPACAAEPRNPASGDKVLISFGTWNVLETVIHPWLQQQFVSPDGYVGVVVKMDGKEQMFTHKSMGAGTPYWEWPA